MNTSKNDNNGQNNDLKADDYDYELERIRLQRMQKAINLKKEKELVKKAGQSLDQKIESVLKVILTADAYFYLKSIQSRDRILFERIKGTILPPEIMAQFNTLVLYLQQGLLRPGIISKTDIQFMERKILGIGSKITVKKRNQESTDLNSFLRKS